MLYFRNTDKHSFKRNLSQSIVLENKVAIHHLLNVAFYAKGYSKGYLDITPDLPKSYNQNHISIKMY